MKKIFFAIAMLIGMHAFAQSDYDVSKDKESGSIVFKGQMTFEDMDKEPSFTWLKRGTDSYKPDTVVMKFLKKNLPNYDIVVLMGTWCDDSHNMIPKLRKVLQLSAYPMSRYMMYGLDRAKTAKYVEHRLYKVDKVPTVIVYKNHVELGRITELVKRSIESDLAEIIRPDVEKQEMAQQQK